MRSPGQVWYDATAGPVGEGRLPMGAHLFAVSTPRISCPLSLVALLCVAPLVSPTAADVFGGGANSFEIEFVSVPVVGEHEVPNVDENGVRICHRCTIAIPGNPPDRSGAPSPAGSVPYEYRIGKYEISEQMIDKANALGGLGITKDTRGPDKPATNIDWFEAARFVNWLNTSTGHTPAYKFVEVPSPRPSIPPSLEFALWEPSDAGYNPNNLFRNSRAIYFLPSMNEWYKAAFYDPASGTYFDYPTGSNIPPIAVASGTAPGTAVFNQDLAAGPADIMQAGGLSPYGTMAQGGNVNEWLETKSDLLNDDPSGLRGRRGASWSALSFSLSASITRTGLGGSGGTGFRIASVIPEPRAAILSLIASHAMLGLRIRRSIAR